MEKAKFNQQSAAKAIEETTVQSIGSEYVDFAKIQAQGNKTRPVEPQLITVDKKMLRIREIVEQIADANVPVLVTGESGTGKEVIARMIHNASNRSKAPFVAINCAALPPALLESELFGYEKGAFTGAHQRHIGKFEQASGGTLLLDEVTEMEPALQAKLLRALQEKEIERLGGSGAISIDTRIIATTNRDIKGIVNEGSFRQDLYYRLYVINLEVPPLRERKDDVEALAKHYLEKFGQQFDRPGLVITQEGMDRLKNYPWPGNVRELQNIIQRSILMAKDNVIQAFDLPLAGPTGSAKNLDWVAALPLGRPMREVETHFIIETLKHHNGNRTHAAKTLGISLRTLRNKINEFTAMGITVPTPTTGKAL